MTHVNNYTGVSYADDPTIIGYETGNELGGIVFGDKNVPVEWTREICQLIKKLGMSLRSLSPNTSNTAIFLTAATCNAAPSIVRMPSRHSPRFPVAFRTMNICALPKFQLTTNTYRTK
jgi:hypothetical protein